ncbi:hypothetical protein [Neptunicoccus cionae]|uniref:hypothetical protein n=1 Tax=Neptunicoccus cionae TaxID=2035344 RepID=UPI0011AE1A81|nr:hypothetical protein [Amylibacter cionae]
MIYLLASSTSRFDVHKLSAWEVAARFGAAIFLISPTLYIHGAAAIAGIALLTFHRFSHRTAGTIA